MNNAPVAQFLKKIYQNRSHGSIMYHKAIPWILKNMITTPFRLLERTAYHRQVQKHRLTKDPIFVLGHWRSGTSFLQYLVCQDPQFGYLSKFQSVFPELFLESEETIKPLIEKVSNYLETTDHLRDISVNWDWDSPGELDIATTTMMTETTPHWGHVFPQNYRSYFDKYLYLRSTAGEERSEWLRNYDHFIKKLSIKNDGRQIVIKSPGNTARVRYLLEMYPDAKFIYIHRNPVDVFYSNRKLWNVLLDNISLQKMGSDELDEAILKTYERVMTCYFTDRDLIPKGNLAELTFESFVADPLTEMETVYETLALPGFETAKPEIRAFLDSQSSSGSSSYAYDPDIIRTIGERWAFSLDRYPYDLEAFLEDDADEKNVTPKDETVSEYSL